MTPFISLCMIVKNEEKVLKRCLDSVKGYVDEMIITDTGSIDNTRKIALSFTSSVYDYEWTGDFSAARNFTQSKATGEWIIYLDADEYVDGENLKQIIQQLRDSKELGKNDAFVVTQINFVGTLGGNVGQCPTIRIYKNDQAIQFHRTIHEQLYKKEGQLTIGYLGLNVYHSGYLSSTAEEKNKNERNVSLIKNEIKRNRKNGFDHYNLANEYLTQWKVEDALSSYRKAFKLKGSINKLWVPMAVERIIFCLLELKRYNEALDVIRGAVIEWPNVADFISQKALIYFMQNRFEDAEKELAPLIQNRYKYTTVQSLSYLDYLPNFILGRISENKNDLHNAVRYYAQALNFNDKDVDTLRKLYPLLLKNESKESIIDFIDRNPSMKNDINRIYFLKILLDMGEIDLVEHYFKEWNIAPSNGFKFKLNVVKERYNFAKSLLSKNSMSELLAEGWADSYDILLLALHLEKIDVFHQLKKDQNHGEFDCLEALFEEVPIYDVEKFKSHIIKLLDRCLALKNFTLIDRIIQKIVNLNMNKEIGNLFYKHGFGSIAMDFYVASEDYHLLNDQAYVNIIEAFLLNKDEEEALQWAFAGLEQNKTDYRIFKAAIQLLDKRGAHDDMEKIIEMASIVYPESKYLQEFGSIISKV